MATAALIGVPSSRAAATVSVWGLDPDGGHDDCGCSACSACRSHSSNKIFASAADADTGRAHPHCKCAVSQLGSVDSHVFEALFVNGGRRSSVDRRWQWVQAALASVAPVPPPSPPLPPQVPSDGTPSPPRGATEAPPRAPQRAASVAAVRAAWIRRPAPARRVLYVQLEAGRMVEAEIVLLRNRRALARRRITTVSGRQTIRIPLRAEITQGPARLRVGFSGPGGEKHTSSLMLSVPAKHPRGR